MLRYDKVEWGGKRGKTGAMVRRWKAAQHSKMADDDTLNTTTTTGGGIIFDTYTDWWVFLTITVVCWSVVYGVVSKSMRDASERERAA